MTVFTTVHKDFTFNLGKSIFLGVMNVLLSLTAKIGVRHRLLMLISIYIEERKLAEGGNE